MKVKGSVTIDVWFDEKLRLFGAAYKDSKGQILGEAEYGPSKTSALKALEEDGPELEFEKVKNDNRDY
jgi:hypothetical protein